MSPQEMTGPQRLPGGCVILDPPTAELVGSLIEIALRHRRDLWTARDQPSAERVRRLRDLTEVVFAGTSESESAETVSGAGQASSVSTSTQEAAGMLGITPQRVTQLCRAGRLAGEQDGPGRPWRVDVASVEAHRRETVA